MTTGQRSRLWIPAFAGMTGVLILFLTTPVQAQPGSSVVGDMAGPWIVLPTDGKPGCPLTLTARSTGDAWAAKAGPSCAKTIPALAATTRWSLDGGATLLDARGRTLMVFVEDETALFSSPDLQAPRHYLIPAIPGYTHIPQAAELTGPWTLARHGKPVCTVTLTAKKSVKFAPACTRTPIAKLTRWDPEDMYLLLSGPNDRQLSFAPTGAMRYATDEGGWTLRR